MCKELKMYSHIDGDFFKSINNQFLRFLGIFTVQCPRRNENKGRDVEQSFLQSAQLIIERQCLEKNGMSNLLTQSC